MWEAAPMRKLLNASFSRLWKNKVFWIAIACIVVAAVIISLQIELESVETVMLNVFPVIPLVCVVFISIFIGTEFEENTIRNKLIVGYTKTEIYFANYLVSIVGSLILLFAIIIFCGITGFAQTDKFILEGKQLAFVIFCTILITMIESAICVGIVMNVNKTVFSLLFGLLILFGLMFLSAYIENSLGETEYVQRVISISADDVANYETVLNPHYVSGTTRKVMEFVLDLLPTGQAVQISNVSLERCMRWPALSVLSLGLVTVVGWLPFRKKDNR